MYLPSHPKLLWDTSDSELMRIFEECLKSYSSIFNFYARKISSKKNPTPSHNKFSDKLTFRWGAISIANIEVDISKVPRNVEFIIDAMKHHDNVFMYILKNYWDLVADYCEKWGNSRVDDLIEADIAKYYMLKTTPND